MDSLGQGLVGMGAPPGERPPNMLASIQSYLNRTQELMQNPTVLLPSLPDPHAQGKLLLHCLSFDTIILHLQAIHLHAADWLHACLS